MTSFAETVVTYPDGQINVETLPVTLLANGFIPKQKGTNGQPLVANWLNWLFREVFRKINRDRVTDGLGVNSISTDECMVTLYAVVKTDPAKYIHAVGYKTASGVPVMQVLSSATLSLGILTATNTPVSGAASDTIAVRVTTSEIL